MKAINAVLGMISAALLFCGLACAQGPGEPPGPGFGMHRPPLEQALGPGPGGRWWNDPAMIEKLGLSEDQRKNMDDILLQHRSQLIDMRAAVEKAELGLEPLVNADAPNEQQILAQIDKVAQARAELEKANARFLLAIRAKLTPDQYHQLQAARAERRMMHHNGRGDFHRQPGSEGGPQTAPAPPPPGPQGMIPEGVGTGLVPGNPPSAEAGAIE
ncbi:periplasmic heavy metal sensor [Acidobacteria bacterium AB60]|nr:periplasmic heavy metal sensor [Acidobacteria bacterium AB60]